jgi:hypothetical protein
MAIQLHVYVIHAKFLAVRKPIIDTFFEKLNDSQLFEVTSEFITEHDPQDVISGDIRSLININKTNQPTDAFDGLVKNLHVKNISNALKHKEAFKRISEQKGKGLSLVIEDDVVYGEDVATKLAALIDDIGKRLVDWDICYLGLPQPMNTQNTNAIRPTSDLFKLLPCIESYLVHSSAAEKIYKQFHPIRFVTNIHMSYICAKNPEIKNMMSTSNIFIDGTKFGVYLSTLEPNNKLFLNTDFVKLSQIVLKNETVLTSEEISTANAIITNMKFKNHPDVVSLQALLKEKQGEYSEAKTLFDTAYNTYMNNECIINNESEFMIHYTRIFKYSQD